MSAKCETCGAPAPHLHPAVQFGGEVSVCSNAFHLMPTPQNAAAYIALVEAKRAGLAALNTPVGGDLASVAGALTHGSNEPANPNHHSAGKEG